MKQPASHLRRGILMALVTAPFAIFSITSKAEPIESSTIQLRKLYRRGVRVRMAELRAGDVFVSVEPGCRPLAFVAKGYPDLFADPHEVCAITCEVLS